MLAALPAWAQAVGSCSAPRASAPSLLAQAAARPAVAPAASAPAAGEPLQIEADEVHSRLGEDLRAQGKVHLRRGVLTLQADQIDYTLGNNRARATGNVRLDRAGDVFTGPEVELDTTRLEGFFRKPTYRFGRTDAGGTADRVNFLGPNRVSVEGATYSSCDPVEPGETLPWVLSSRRVRLDFEQNEGVAEGAVLRFYDVPILAVPVLSFPVTEERKSGWLPPQFTTSSTLGLEVATPYYWNIAPQHDLTLTPTVSTKRGPGLGAEFRYLRPEYNGRVEAYGMPHDRAAGDERWSWLLEHQGTLGREWDYQVRGLRVSDDSYWKDDLRGGDFLTPRLLPLRAQTQARQDLRWGTTGVEQTLYAQAQTWQVLQETSTDSAWIDAPYSRQPQVGGRWRNLDGPIDWQFQTEATRFTHPDVDKTDGSRAHMTGSVAWPLRLDGLQLTPRLAFNAAAYQTDLAMSDGRTSRARFIPTFSLDSRWTFEREMNAFDRDMTQTLEPRIRYVKTPYRDQTGLPNFDSAALDFGFDSIFADNAFSGIDRVSDAHQVTAGATTRFISRESGGELARFSMAQRYQMSAQQLAPEGQTQSSRISDVLLQASTSALRFWQFDATAQYDTDQGEVSRAITRVRYSPGAYRTVNLAYRLTRDASEQLSFGWQWPIRGWSSVWRSTPTAVPASDTPALNLDRAPRNTSDCRGELYGVGWMDYSLRDRRMTTATAGLEYDAGCWIGRLVAQRKSTAADSSTTKVMFQIEFVGLSRLSLGANPLGPLRDNIPGYQMLRDRFDARATDDSVVSPQPASTGVNLSP